MTTLPTLHEFEQYAAKYVPFPWENGEDDAFMPEDVRGKHSVLVSLVRFWKVVAALKSNRPEFESVVDVGAYPGVMAKVLRHYFQQDFKYWAIGLGFTDAYREEMLKLGGECFNTEIDPTFPSPGPVRDWPIRNADCALLLDVIEHLVDPAFGLDAINKALRMGGILVVTTDNLTSFANAYQMLRKGKSPNIHPVRSNYIFRGDWRPHFREFSKGEVEFFLRYSGFEIVTHEYFERRQGDYALQTNGVVQARNRYAGVKGAIQHALLRRAPHLCDHQIVVCRKALEHEEAVNTRPKPTTSKAQWLQLMTRMSQNDEAARR